MFTKKTKQNAVHILLLEHKEIMSQVGLTFPPEHNRLTRHVDF